MTNVLHCFHHVLLFLSLRFFGHCCKVNSINLAHSVHRPLFKEYLRNTISSGSYISESFILVNIPIHTQVRIDQSFEVP